MKKIRILAFLALILGLLVILVLFLLPRLGFNFISLLNQGSIDNVRVQEGFTINVFAEDLAGPRFIAFGPDGVLYVAERGENRIVALPDEDSDGRADAVISFAEGLDSVHSLAYFEGSWFAGLPLGIVKLTDENGDLSADSRTTIYENYTSGQHNTRTVVFLQDGRMVFSLGSTCNICEETDPLRAAVSIFDGDLPRVWASGLRNAVGLAVHPETGELWATNNGRDLMGDDEPPETIHLLRDGDNYGLSLIHI